MQCALTSPAPAVVLLVYRPGNRMEMAGLTADSARYDRVETDGVMGWRSTPRPFASPPNPVADRRDRRVQGRLAGDRPDRAGTSVRAAPRRHHREHRLLDPHRRREAQRPGGRELLANIRIGSFTTRDEQEVAGYAEVMETIFNAYDAIPLTENHIRQLHRDLLVHSTKDERHRGSYKTLANHVEAFDEEGKSLGVVFETATPFDTPRRMAELVEWVAGKEKDRSLHPLLVIAVFVVVFLEIHPFQDGNGRLSRILTTLMLLRAGYAYVPYSSLESVIEQSKDGYYLSLRRTQGTIRTDAPDWNPWLEFFLRRHAAARSSGLKRRWSASGSCSPPCRSCRC